MKFRTTVMVFFILFAVVSAALWFMARTVIARSVPPNLILTAAREALQREESDLAGRLIIKGIFYCRDPEPFLTLAEGQPALQDYAKAVEQLRGGPSEAAEKWLERAAASGTPLLAARAKIRLDEIRYGTGMPNADRLPF